LLLHDFIEILARLGQKSKEEKRGVTNVFVNIERAEKLTKNKNGIWSFCGIGYRSGGKEAKQVDNLPKMH